MGWVLLGAGLVLVIEGLVFALLPDRLEDALEALKNVPPETRRMLGLGAVALGVLLVWTARQIGV